MNPAKIDMGTMIHYGVIPISALPAVWRSRVVLDDLGFWDYSDGEIQLSGSDTEILVIRSRQVGKFPRLVTGGCDLMGKAKGSLAQCYMLPDMSEPEPAPEPAPAASEPAPAPEPASAPEPEPALEPEYVLTATSSDPLEPVPVMRETYQLQGEAEGRAKYLRMIGYVVQVKPTVMQQH